jgi:hypothetical protein
MNLKEHLKLAPGNERRHYKGEIQPIEFIEDQELGPHEANIVKYICRYKDKGGAEDLEKAKWYIERLIYLYKNNIDQEENLSTTAKDSTFNWKELF